MKPCILVIMAMVWLTLDAVQYSITNPGHYQLGSDIIYNPLSADDQIIRISASDVILNLNNFTIRQDPSNTFDTIQGIVIDPNLSNITIQNGTIAQITGTGLIINEGCSRITIENIQTYSCGFAGMYAFGTSNNPITELAIDQCVTYSCGALSTDAVASAVIINSCRNSTVSNCRIENNRNDLTNFSGLWTFDTQLTNFSNIIVRDNSSAVDIVGFLIQQGYALYFNNCSAVSNIVTPEGSGTSGGFLVSLPADVNGNINFKQCIASSNSGGVVASGFAVNDALYQNISFTDCRAVTGFGTEQSYGFVLSSNNCEIIDCIARNNKATQSGATLAVGFFLNGAGTVTVENCLSEFQGAITASGFDLEDAALCVVKNCTSTNNLGESDPNCFGFRINPSSGTPDLGQNVLVSNMAMNNGADPNNQMSNFIAGTFTNISYSSLDTVTPPFINVGIVG